MNIMCGDLIKLAKANTFDVIVHGNNCFNTWGAGIALQLKKSFPAAYKADQKTTRGDINKLGTITYALSNNILVVNAYTQYHYGHQGKHVDYTALRNCFKLIKNNFSGCRIGYPQIGAGLAGGDWNIISSIINDELYDEDHTLVIFKKL